LRLYDEGRPVLFYNFIHKAYHIRMCEHLQTLEQEIKAKGIKETSRGQAWTDNCREWVYFDCYLDTEKIKSRLSLPEFIVRHVNEDPKSGY